MSLALLFSILLDVNLGIWDAFLDVFGIVFETFCHNYTNGIPILSTVMSGFYGYLDDLYIYLDNSKYSFFLFEKAFNYTLSILMLN